MSQATPLSSIPAISIQGSHEHSLMSLSLVTFIAAASLFVISLFLPVFITQTHDIYGYWVLIMGWLGFITFQFAWYATPFAILSIHISRKSPQLGLFLSVVAIIMASEAFLFTQVPFGKGDKVLDYDIGFYLWYLCFYLISFSILLRLVVWGSVEEETPLNTETTKKNMVEKNDKTPSSFVAKAKRKILSEQESVVSQKPDIQQYTRYKSPPQLPRKNIYEKKVKAEVLPPPLPKISLKQRASQGFIEPPPLPKRQRWKTTVEAIKPPPLPAARNLAIAPFLRTSD